MNWITTRRRQYNSKKYKRNRRLLLMDNPNCRECERNGRIVAATECDHIVSIRKWIESGLPESECSGMQNLQVLCEDCHREKTDGERKAWLKSRFPVFDIRGRRVA